MKEIVWSRVVKAASLKRVINSFVVLSSFVLSMISKKSYVRGVPFILTVEPTVLCNLRCPQCLTGMGDIERDQNSFDLKMFKDIIEQVGDKIWYMLLYNQGEPFLNSKLLDFIKIAKQKRIYVTTSTNGHFLTDEKYVEKLVKSGLDTIIISLDGANTETYSKYRIGGDFERVISGIEKLIQIRNHLKSNTPKIMVQCLVTRDTESQLKDIKNLAKELNVDRLLLKTFQAESLEKGLDFLPKNSKWRRYSIDNKKLKHKNGSIKNCTRLWYSTVILSDGRIVPCCFDKNGKYTFGNITKTESIHQIWKSDAYNKFRENILQRREPYEICKNCTQNHAIYL